MGEVIRALDNSTTVRELMRPIAPHLERSDVTEVAINAPGAIWVLSGNEWQEFKLPALTAQRLTALANAMAVYRGLTLTPMLDVQLPDGERAHVTLPPACVDHQITFNIRKHVEHSFTLEQLVAQGAFDGARDVSFNKPTEAEITQLLEATDMSRLTEGEAELLRLKTSGDWLAFLSAALRLRRNILVVGKTGSGKTTFTRALVKKIPTDERIITIEDVPELKLEDHPNTVHLLYASKEGVAGRISASEALRSCMRMSPDRILLAELRGDESLVYLESLNTGHPGSITTTHANSAIEGYDRVADLIEDAKGGGKRESICQKLYKTLQVVLFMDARKVTEVFYDPVFSKAQ